MAVGQITNDGAGAGSIFSRTPTIVRVKRLWSDPWVNVNYLSAVRGETAVSPGVSRMTLRYRYGNVKHEGNTIFAQERPLNFDNYYVEVSVVFPKATAAQTELKIWWGVIAAPSYDIHGEDVARPSGWQTLTAYGLEHLLDRINIDGSFMTSPGGSVQKVDWSPPFNQRHAGASRVTGNKAPSDSAFGGDEDLDPDDPARIWTTFDILEYLKQFFPGAPPFDYEIPGDVKNFLSLIEPVLRVEGLTVRGALNALLSRNRGLSWTIETDGEGTIWIRVFSLVDEEVTVGLHTLPRNNNVADVSFTDSIDMPGVLVSIAEQSRYDIVKVRGARMKSCCTLSAQDGDTGTLEAGWTETEESEYAEPFNGSAQLNDLARSQERFDRVFQLFRAPPEWDWLAGDGEGGDLNIVNPDATPYGTIAVTTQATFSNYFKGFLNYLPFLTGKDYSVSLTSPTNYLPDGAEPVNRKPFVLFKYERSGRFYYAERIYHPTWGLYSASFSMVDRELAVKLDTNPNHSLALNHWPDAGPGGDSMLVPSVDNAADWESLIVTVFVETDSRPYVEVNIERKTQSETPRKFTITMEDVELWYVTPGTVCDVSNAGALTRVAEGGLIRDDSERLRSVAAAAASWYSKRRARVAMQFKGVQFPYDPGTMIISTDDATTDGIGTAVTRIMWDFGSKDVVGSTRVETGFAELDFLGI